MILFFRVRTIYGFEKKKISEKKIKNKYLDILPWQTVLSAPLAPQG